MRRIRRQTTVGFLVVCLMTALPLFAHSGTTTPASVPALVQLVQQGDYPDALHMSGELLRSQPRSSTVWTLRGMALERSGQPKEALAAYQHALNLDANYLPALEGAAQLSYKSQSAQAVPLLRKIIALQPANPTAHAMLAILEYRRGDLNPAAEDFAAADAAIRTQPDALMTYSICLARLNRPGEAIARLHQLIALRPRDAAALYDLALIQWRSGAGSDALATLQPLLDAHTSDSRVLCLAAAIHEANNETPQAIELLRTAIISNPDDPAAYVAFATLSFTHGSYSVGIDMVNVGLARLPNSSDLYMARGVLYGQSGEFEKAMADFEKAHNLDPAFSLATTAEGLAESQQHHNDKALQDFRLQVREHPNDAFGYYLLAEALSWAPPAAKKDAASDNITEAISAASKALALDPHLAQAADLLASLYLQKGEPEQAAKVSRAALAINPKDQQAVYSLILALRKTGPKEELKGLVQKLTNLRKAEQAENNRTARYGRLVESP